MQKLRHGARVTTNTSRPLLCTQEKPPPSQSLAWLWSPFSLHQHVVRAYSSLRATSCT